MAKKDADIEKTSALLKAVSDTDRIKLVLQLRDGKKNVGTLARAIGVEIVNVSHHLGVLRENKVVHAQKVGRHVFYSLNPDLMRQEGSTLHFQLAGAKLVIH